MRGNYAALCSYARKAGEHGESSYACCLEWFEDMRLEDLIGRRLGRYEIIGLIGRGGMAAVYRAHDTALRRDVALKVLYPQYGGDAALVERFQREAVLAANLDHPNILPIYDVGEADGLVYIAMRLLSGRSFADILRMRGALPPADLLPIVEQIASALDYAHARQIVHRDIKPANILIEGEGDDRWAIGGKSSIPQAVLTDFGIAKSLDPLAAGLTVTGVLIGTPEYMAPEQITGSNQVDARADIYALGVLVYRALTGRRPFEGGTQEVLMGHLHGTPADPSSLDPSLPPAFDAVLRMALARDPRQRYASAGEFALALRRAAAMEPAPALRRAAVTQAAGDQARPNVALANQPTRRSTIVPARHTQSHSYPQADQPGPAIERREPRGAGMAWALLGIVLALAIGGGILYASGLLPGSGGTGNIATAIPTSPPAASAAPTALPLPSSAPTAAPTSLPTAAAQPTAAPTSTPTATPTPTKTTAPTNTTRPTATPTATTAPTATPTATTVPTETPEPTSDIPITGGFAALLEQDQGLREILGDPLEAEQGGPRKGTEQQFENGSMFYFDPTGQIYVLFGEAQGTFRVFERKQMEQLPEPPPPPASCTEPQQGGFALVWGNFPEIQQQLGCPISPEPDLFESAYQPFEGGTLLWSRRGLGRGPTIYALFKDRQFERFKDPNQ
jgi:serine/threonine-protein kinase